MTEKKQKLQPINPLNYRLQLILFFISATLWEPFYNFLCFKKLNELADYPKPEGVPSTKNSVLINVLLVLSIVGAPIAYYRRYKLLREYIQAIDPHLEPLAKETNKKGEEIETNRVNCIEGKKFAGYAVTTFLSIGILVACFVVGIIFAVQNSLIQPLTGNLWTDGAYMILILIGINMVFITVGFSIRTAEEEQKWFTAFNAISIEMMKLNNVTIPVKVSNGEQSAK